VSSYPVPDTAVPVSAGMIVAVPAELLASPLRSGRGLGGADRSALVIGGTERIRTGGPVVFVKVVAVTEAVVTRDGQVRAAGRPYDHATLGPLEEWLDAQAGPGVIDGIAERAVLDGRYVRGRYRRLLSAAFMIRAIVLWTLMPEAQMSDVITALAGDLALLPWSRRWRAASERACLDWRRALGAAPLEELQGTVLGAARGEHAQRDGQSLTVGKSRPLKVHSADGSLLRVPDTPANRAAFGSVGTAGDSAAWPCVRLFPLTSVFTRSLLAMPWGAAGTDKAAAEQGLLDAAMRDCPHVFAEDQVWLLDRLWHGVRRIAVLAGLTHVLVRVKSDIPITMTSPVLPDGSYLAEVSGDGAVMTVRVVEYYADVEGQLVPEMFCLVTDLLDWEEYPAIELAGLYKWRWDGSETSLREAKAPLHGAGPGTGAMLRSGSPLLVVGDRRLGHRDRDDPRRHPRRRPRRGARPQRPPGRAARPLP
jgi:Insertion element 4 transposase N-terminal